MKRSAAITVALVVLAAAALAQEPTPLFSPAPSAAALAAPAELSPGMLRARPVAINPAAFRLFADFAAVGGVAADPALPVGRFSVSFFPEDPPAVFSVLTATAGIFSDGYTITAEGPAGVGSFTASISVSDDGGVSVDGTVSLPGRRLRIRPSGSGVHAVSELDPDLPPPSVSEPLVPPDAGASDAAEPMASAAAASAASPAQVDVLGIVTPAVIRAYGGEDGVRAAADRVLAAANASFSASGAHVSLSGWLVELDYNEVGGDLSTDLQRLQGSADGFLDEVHALREELGADLVHLFVSYDPSTADDGSFTCGRAWIRPRATHAFGVTLVHDWCDNTFAHEVGHNLGVAHDRYQKFTYESGTAPEAWAYGYGNAGSFTPLSAYCGWTIMSYYKHCYDVPGGRAVAVGLPRWSNPNQRYQDGHPLGVFGGVETHGVQGPADAVRTLNSRAPIVAAFRDRVDITTEDVTDTGVGSVRASPSDQVRPGGAVTLSAVLSNSGNTAVDNHDLGFFSGYVNSDGQVPEGGWTHHASRRVDQLRAGAFISHDWTGTAGDDPGDEAWAVCFFVEDDTDDSDQCGFAVLEVVDGSDPVGQGGLVASATGTLAIGTEVEVEFGLTADDPGPLEVQDHWFVLSYEPVDEMVWGSADEWYCFEDDWTDCWLDESGGDQDPAADWRWRSRSWGFGVEGSFSLLLGLDAFPWWPARLWRFRFAEATWSGEEADSTLSYRSGVFRSDDAAAASSSAGIASLTMPRAGAEIRGPRVARVPLAAPPRPGPPREKRLSGEEPLRMR